MVNSLARRMELQAFFKTLTDHVYHQKPVNVQMKYPCIVYEIDDIDTDHADNNPYRSTVRYQVTVIDEDPDSSLRIEIASLPLCVFNRHYVADQLNHDVFNLFF